MIEDADAYDAGVTLRVVGAGLGRTGTSSLKLALERLLGGPCHHMSEVLADPATHLALWAPVLRGEPVEWEDVFAGYVASVDFPGAGFWPAIGDYSARVRSMTASASRTASSGPIASPSARSCRTR